MRSEEKIKRKHHDLLVWQEAMALVKEIYRLTSHFPKEEIYALTSQMRRAAVSIPSNIAEGAARNGSKEFLQFLSIARGSLSELEPQLLIAQDLGYSTDTFFAEKKIEKLFALIGGLTKSVQERSKK